MGASLVQHVFVLMLENRSFDHMLGFSGLTGSDAATGAATQINGLTGTESNSFNGQPFTVSPGAPDRMPADPGHEFWNVLLQLCGTGAAYPPAGAYPAINNSGYVASYASGAGAGNPGIVMNCYSATQLPVLHALAAEFVVCDNWHASLPGPTWPNRMFLHAARRADSITAPALRKSPSGKQLQASRSPTARFSMRCIKTASPTGSMAATNFPWFPRSRASISVISAPSASSPMTCARRRIPSAMFSSSRATMWPTTTGMAPRNIRWRRKSWRSFHQSHLRGYPQFRFLGNQPADHHLGRARRVLRSCDSPRCCRAR